VEDRDNQEDLDVDGRVISKYILWEYAGRTWNLFSWLRIGISGGLF
jgi:hypothetical protein